MTRWFWTTILGATLILVGGCGFVTHPIATLEAVMYGPQEPAASTPQAGEVGASSAPFPWDWILGFGLLTGFALGVARWLKLDFLREEILATGVGLAAIRPILILTRDLLALWWQAALILVVGVAAALGWKLLRRWLDKNKAG